MGKTYHTAVVEMSTYRSFASVLLIPSEPLQSWGIAHPYLPIFLCNRPQKDGCFY